ncbi:hypothetical protein M413DRAFT_281536 [Hebeloma cylindrosporum]|uniref:Uncharacterized protein n=1 Tax=Hebeloma cylindrosporum TaxID=76867 RepID=A0A0C2XG17_HEBCY|nr:hypothetical protein M413DRAFT_281536 [Hebeloma cylindrosporum h7]
MSARKPYGGSARKLVMAFDVGTTFSGVSYCILDPGAVPEIRGVTRFPGQAKVGGDSKIPTILYYDQQGNVCAVGDEANEEGIEQIAEEKEWTRAEWFKLHMRPKTKSAAHVTDKIVPLPKGKTVIDVFADFLRYMYQCAQKYIEETHANGVSLWENLRPTSEFVLTHPNGWEGAQQGMVRRAAVTAGLIPDNDAGQARLSFVTEGEASLHFCIQNGLTNEAIKTGKGIIIVDAGGGTIDISTYKQKPNAGQAFEEIAAPQCFFKGSIFVTSNAKDFLDKLLQESAYLDDAPDIARRFDKTTKLRFRDPEEPQYIKFGSLKDKDPLVGIRSGQIRLNGSDIASFFEPSIQCIIESIKDQRNASNTEIASVFLVGGFAASDWLFTKLKQDLALQGLVVSRPDSHVNKAVADGAVSFRIDHYVTARVSKFAFGVNCCTEYDAKNPEHISRSYYKFIGLDGIAKIDGLFSNILPKGSTVNETQEFRRPFLRKRRCRSGLGSFVVDISCYRGNQILEAESFTDKDPRMFSTLCSVEADISHIETPAKVATHDFTVYYIIEFDIVFSFGLTELKAFIAWEENGVEKRSPARVVYDPDAIIADE